MDCSSLAPDLWDNGSPAQVFILIFYYSPLGFSHNRLILFASVFFCVCVCVCTLFNVFNIPPCSRNGRQERLVRKEERELTRKKAF